MFDPDYVSPVDRVTAAVLTLAAVVGKRETDASWATVQRNVDSEYRKWLRDIQPGDGDRE